MENFHEHDLSQGTGFIVPKGAKFFYGMGGRSLKVGQFGENKTRLLDCHLNFKDYFYRGIQLPAEWFEAADSDGIKWVKEVFREKVDSLHLTQISQSEFKQIESYLPVCVNFLKQFCNGNLKFVFGVSSKRIESSRSPYNFSNGVKSYWNSYCFTRERA